MGMLRSSQSGTEDRGLSSQIHAGLYGQNLRLDVDPLQMPIIQDLSISSRSRQCRINIGYANEQKQTLGQHLFPIIQTMYPKLAGRIIGFLLEMDISELKHMLINLELLKVKVKEVVAVLQAQKNQSSTP